MSGTLYELQMLANYTFSNERLLVNALTHSSYANESGLGKGASNERLEFLGDAVLELIVSEYIYRAKPEMPEGEMTKLRASIVCEENLSHHARLLNLGEYMLLGRGERATGGAARSALLADAFEAVLGAVFLDGGIEKAKEYALRFLAGDVLLDENGGGRKTDYKTELQEIVQRDSKEPLIYSVLSADGPDHNKKFISGVSHAGALIGTGEGRTKKESEQHAAQMALEALKKKPPNR